MKHTLFTLLLGVLISMGLFSCQNDRELVSNPSTGDNDCTEFSIAVNIPDEMRTRSASPGTIGLDGLYEFPTRDINKLWYAVYYDDSYKMSNTVTSSEKGLGTFNVNFSLTGTIDPSKLNIFFWAGNADDEVSVNGSRPLSFDFNVGSVLINNNVFNGTDNVAIYDSFAAYVNFADYSLENRQNATITLKRPFAQIHILSDDFIVSDLKDDFRDGVYVFPGIADGEPSTGSKNSSINNIYQPMKWYYRVKTLYVDGSLPSGGSKNYEFHNTLSGTLPERVNFKGRPMDYLTCFYVFIPEFEDLKKGTGSTVLSNQITKINFAISTKSNIDSNSGDNYISIDLPEGGLKANNKYIIYNRSREEGGSGFLKDKYNFQLTVVEDGNWETPDTELTN